MRAHIARSTPYNRRSLGGTIIIWRHLVSVDYCCGGLFGWYCFAFFCFSKSLLTL